MWACQVLIPSVETEVCFLISVSAPKPIGTWYDQTYWRWTSHKHTCNIFLVFGWVWLPNRCGHAEWHLQTTSCKVFFLISVSTPTPIGTQHDHSWQTNTHHLGYKGWKLHSRLMHLNHFVYNTLTCSELLLFSVSIENPDASRPIPSSPPCTGRSHMYVDSRMVTIDSRSLVYTKVHPPPPRIVQDNNRHIDSIQYPMSTIRFCMHVPETL